MKKAQKVVDKFIELFNTTPLVVQAPGRINLIGEHVDYNLGTVLPATINKRIYLAISERTDTEVHIVSSDFDDRFSTNLDSLSSAKLWPQYVLGPMSEIQKRVTFLNGFNIVFGGDIPLSAGLSSSAALTVAVTFALNELLKLRLPSVDIAKIAQEAEQNFLHVNSGLMDQVHF